MVMAHPDDELIFGWPILQDPGLRKRILVCSSDLHNPDREWCRHRKWALFRMCEKLNIQAECLDYDSEFYRIRHRPPPVATGFRRRLAHRLNKILLMERNIGANCNLSQMIEDIHSRIQAIPCDYVFTHNAWGEYGHLDHVLLHQIALSTKHPGLVTDMFIHSDWIPYHSRPTGMSRVYCHTPICDCELDRSFYETCSQFYKETNVWTWNQSPIDKCKLYLL